MTLITRFVVSVKVVLENLAGAKRFFKQMATIKVEESLLIGAPPDKVYAILADPKHHKHILPDVFISYGAESESIVAFTVKAGFIKRDYRVRTEQTEPNKLFRETDIDKNITTEFRLEPHEQGTVVTIATNYETEPTISGYIESIFGPKFLHKLYHEELVKLGRYALVATVD